MNAHQAAADITATLPELTHEVTRSITLQNPFALVRILTRYTQKMVQQQNISMVEKCLNLIGRIHARGDLMTRHAVEHVFVFSMDHIILSRSPTERNQVMEKVPASLYQIYLKEVYKTGM